MGLMAKSKVCGAEHRAILGFTPEPEAATEALPGLRAPAEEEARERACKVEA